MSAFGIEWFDLPDIGASKNDGAWNIPLQGQLEPIVGRLSRGAVYEQNLREPSWGSLPNRALRNQFGGKPKDSVESGIEIR
jgi:hypothetical protein